MTYLRLWLQVGGLIAGFIGSVFLGIAQQIPGRGGIGQGWVDDKGRERVADYVVLRHPYLWRWGLILLGVGFALQLLSYVGGSR